MEFEYSIDISAAPARVWEVMTDVERWPEWTASTSDVRLVEGDRLAVGARARVRQPKLPPATWCVTRLEPQQGFEWETASPGMKLVAGHEIAPTDAGVRVTLWVRSSGLVARVASWFTANMGRRYVQLEAEGLKRRSEGAAWPPLAGLPIAGNGTPPIWMSRCGNGISMPRRRDDQGHVVEPAHDRRSDVDCDPSPSASPIWTRSPSLIDARRTQSEHGPERREVQADQLEADHDPQRDHRVLGGASNRMANAGIEFGALEEPTDEDARERPGDGNRERPGDRQREQRVR